ncbi:MAG TPA: hypothetical protein VF062_23445 [Candidatus Limnocylindrales bacterium]
MTTFAPTVDPAEKRGHANRLAELRADLDQLRNPLRRPAIKQRIRTAGGRRVTRWTEPVPLPCLLDLLREAAGGLGSTTRGPERHQTPRSRPPGNLDALDLWSRVLVEISGWHAGLNLPSPPRDQDWQRAVLRMLHDEARRLSPETVAAIADDVHRWWRWAASAADISQTELVELRRV